MLKYMSLLPMWLQVVIILVVLVLVLGFIAAVIYKILTAEKIEAGPTGVKIEDLPDAPPVPEKPEPKHRRRTE